MSMQRIVYLVHNPFYISGGMRVIHEHVNRLAATGVRVEIWSPITAGRAYFEQSVPIVAFDPERLKEPDVLVMCDPGFIPYVADKRPRNKVFLFLQHDPGWVGEQTGEPNFGYLISEQRDDFTSGRWQLLVVSPWLQEAVRTRYGIDSVVVRNGVDVATFRPIRKPASERPKILVYFDPQSWKGGGDAINALILLGARVPDIEAVILSKLVLSTPPGAENSFQFTFPVTMYCSPPQDRLAAIYASADVFLSMSVYEGFGLPVLEAMACGVPVVTTANGGNREFAVDGATARIIPAHDIEAAASALHEVLADGKLQRSLRRGGRRTARNYSWDSVVVQLIEIYAEL